MMKIRNATLVALIALGVAEYASADTSDCALLRSHAESRECLAKKVDVSSMALQKTEDDLRTAIMHWDEDAYWKRKSENALRSSSRDFYRYRKSQCDFNASLAAGGNGAGDRRLECIIELNKRRLDTLHEQMEALQ